MKNVLLFSILIFPFFIFSQTLIISGFIKDSITSEPIINAIVFCKKQNITVHSNENGYYSLAFNTSDSLLIITFQAEGFQRKVLHINTFNETSFNVFLKSVVFQELDEVNVVAEGKPIPELGTFVLPIKLLKQIPMLGGEPDVIKAFQLMPGVSGGKEGTSGLYVRGGSPDQNLFLLDNVPLYYVSHIGGFISTFDPSMIISIKLYKGNFPAKYSGRLSSVIDIRMRDGNKKKRSGEISVGLLSTKFQINGPFKRDSSWTYLLSARRFNLDLITRPLARIYSNGESVAGYTFYDVNFKLVKRFKNQSKLSFTYYDGRDRIFVNASQKREGNNNSAYKYKSNVIWGNRLASLDFNKAIKKNIFGNFTLATTNFRYVTDINSKYSNQGSDNLSNSNSFIFRSKVNDILLKAQLDFNLSDRLKLSSGLNSTYHVFTPGSIENKGVSQTDTLIGTRIHAFENNVFTEGKIKFNDKIAANLGLNFSSFSLRDTTFFSVEPRVLVAVEMLKNLSFQAGYSRMKQYLHYLSYSGAGLPSDLWVPVTKSLVPEIADQFNAGFTFLPSKKNFPFQISIEFFHKQMTNLLEYKEGVSLFSLASIESKIEKNGRGKVYGIEFLFQKTVGKSTGWIAYTWSKNTRTFENINDGHAFPFKYDRRHDVSIVFAHQFSKRIQFNATWVYSTGNAITLAQNNYYQIDLGTYYYSASPQSYQMNSAQEYNGKNGFRMPAYHKLDASVSFTKEKPEGKRVWSFGVYNLYNQQNPFFYFFKKNKQNEVKLNQLTLFPIIPSVNYSFSF